MGEEAIEEAMVLQEHAVEVAAEVVVVATPASRQQYRHYESKSSMQCPDAPCL